MTRFVPTVLADQNTLFRAGLERLFEDSQYRVAASLADLESASAVKLPVSRAVLFIVELEEILSDHGARLSATKTRYPKSRIVIMGRSFSTFDIHLVMRNGADACLLRTITFKELTQALDLIMMGELVFSAGLRLFGDEVRVPERMLEAAPAPKALEDHSTRREQLSKRELQILRCLMDGNSNKSIAIKYCLTEMTVKAHMKAVLRKIGAANRTQAAIWAHQNNLVEASDLFEGNSAH